MKFIDLLNEADSPVMRLYRYLIDTDYKSETDVYTDYFDDSTLHRIMTILKTRDRVTKSKGSYDIEKYYDDMKIQVKKAVEYYNTYAYKNSDYKKITLTSKFLKEFSDLCWNNFEYLIKIKK